MKTKIALIISIFSLSLVLQACSSETSSGKMSSDTVNDVVAANEEIKKEPVKTEVNDNKDNTENKDTNEDVTKEEESAIENNESLIDTSAFVYATKVDLTDSRDITEHINVVVHMEDSVKPGLATQLVFTQTYNFLQQKDIEGAKTITIGVMSGELRVAQITVDVPKFKPEEQLIKSVLDASKIDKMNPEVKNYGQALELW